MVSLNPEQQRAADHVKGACLVTAVPGSGKTATLTQRIINLKVSGVSPRSILALTFTNKAAQEMKKRIRDLDPGCRKVWVSTFHKLCVRILRNYGDRVGLQKGFTIYDDDDSNGVMAKVHRMWAAASDKEIKITPQERKALRARIDDLRESAKPFDLTAEEEGERLAMYIAELRAANAVDFSGMMYLTWKILTKHKDIRDKLVKRFEFVLVDEAQDTNDIQYAIAKIIAAHGNLFMVGDYQQCVHEDEKIPVLVDGEIRNICAGELPPNGQMSSYRNGKHTYSEYTKQPSDAVKGFRFRMESGAELAVSSRHRVFSTGLKSPCGYILYLMYRQDKGFRVGVSSGKLLYGHRHMHEFATKLWVLDVLPDKEAALLEETRISLLFGVPTCVFNAESRGLNQHRVDQVFGQFGQNGKSVLDHYDMDFDLPLWSANSKTTRLYRRTNVYICAHGTKGSQVSMEWSDPALSAVVKGLGASVTMAKSSKIGSRWRCRKFFTNYKKAEVFAGKLAISTGSYIKERLTVEKEHLLLTTASAVKPGCYLPLSSEKGLVLDRVVSIEPIEGNFVSLDLETGVFINSDGVLSHNSIFSWRGAKPENLGRFLVDFPGAANIVLPRNYRSHVEILEKAQNVITKNDDATDVKLVAERGEGGDVHLNSYETEWEEVEGVITHLKDYHADGVPWSDMAIIYRLNKLSQAFEIGLSQKGIPYKTKGGQSFFSRREIKTSLAYLKLLMNPADSAAFAQAVGNPPRGVGDALIGNIDLLAKDRGINVTDAAAKVKARTKTARSGLDEFAALLERKRADLRSGRSLMVVADELMKESGYHSQLSEDAEEEKEGPRSLVRLENLEKFVEGIGDFEDGATNASMSKFLQQIALVQDGDNNKNPDSVSLMTMHAAKGLEYPVVFVIGVNQDVVPHIMAAEEGREDEERRLFYVAMTRAKDHLHISFPELARKWNKMIEMSPSPFLRDMLTTTEEKPTKPHIVRKS